MIAWLVQRIVWRIFGAYRVDPAMLDSIDMAVREQAEQMGLLGETLEPRM